MERKSRTKLGILFTLPLLMVACGGDRPLPDDVVASVGELQLTVDEAAELIAQAPDLPNSPDVVAALGELWVDYTLLGLALIRDPELSGLDLEPLLQQQLDQELVFLLRDEVIQVDSVVTEEELREAFEADPPGEQVRARHILLATPANGDPEELEELEAEAEDLRGRILAGASFEDLAREHSDDPGSAVQGGDLGFFERGMMVPEFEDAAFALDPGEVSPVVQSPFGYHIIRLEERRSSTLEDFRDQLLEEIQMERTMRAESIYVAGIEEPANIQVTDEAFEIVRELADNPTERLSGRAANRALAEYEGGSYTAAQFRDFLGGQPQGIMEQIAGAPDDQIEGMIRNLTRVELLKAEAVEQGLSVPDDEVDRIREELLQGYRDAAQMLGLANLEPEPGESDAEAVERAVREILEGIISGAQNVTPMAELGLPLRRQFGAQIRTESYPQVVERIQALRGDDPAQDVPLEMDLEEMMPTPEEPGVEPEIQPDPQPDDPGRD